MAFKEYFTKRYLFPATSYCARNWVNEEKVGCGDCCKFIPCVIADIILWILCLALLIIIFFLCGIGIILAIIAAIVVVILIIIGLFILGVIILIILWIVSILALITSPLWISIIFIFLIVFYCGLCCFWCKKCSKE